MLQVVAGFETASHTSVTSIYYFRTDGGTFLSDLLLWKLRLNSACQIFKLLAQHFMHILSVTSGLQKYEQIPKGFPCIGIFGTDLRIIFKCVILTDASAS